MTSAILIHPYLKTDTFTFMRQPSDKMRELVSLSEAIDLSVQETFTLKLSEIKPPTYLGMGVVETIKAAIELKKADLVIVNAPITPVQQRNLEQEWGTKVIDRTGLILEIFGERARTNEGRLQVELASVTYQRGRLVRSWTHLERQRGGHGFLGGPGELQIELDRRMLDQKIESLKAQLEKVKKTRSLQRAGRDKKRFFQLALVGYTNAGKSTLFNKLTGEHIFAKDLLFATLDPTIRAVTYHKDLNWVLSDTVGFISDLPTELIAAFRATLEEVEVADILLHVHDSSHPEWKEQKEDVETVLRAIFEDKEFPPVLNVYNKVDLLDEEARAALLQKIEEDTGAVAISAVEGMNLDQLIQMVENLLTKSHREFEVKCPASEMGAISWLYKNGKVIEKIFDEDLVFLRVMLDERAENRFKKMWQSKTVQMRVW